MATVIQVIPTGVHVGAEIRGIDLRETVSASVFLQVENALHEHGVIVFRGQRLSPAQQEQVSQRFGELETPVLEQYTVPGFPNVLILSNVLQDGRPVGLVDAGRFWHSDSTYRPAPARCSLLHAIEVPRDEAGRPLGDTLFVRTDLAYDRLAPGVRERLHGLKARHSFSRPYAKHYDKPAAEGGGQRDKLTEEQKQRTPEAIHPVVRTHPFTGRKCVYVNEGLTAGFVGLGEAEGEALLQQLCTLCTPDDMVYRHHWEVGDVLIWDNCMTQHRATGGYDWPRHRRYLHRTTCKGSAPF